MDSECPGSTCVTTMSCTNNPAKSCTEDVNCNVAVCNSGECQCIPNLCVGPSGSKTCTNDNISCTHDTDCDATCVGECTAGPADNFDCNNTSLMNNNFVCEVDSDCPALVGLTFETGSSCTIGGTDCPENTECVSFGKSVTPQPGQNTPPSYVCRQKCMSNTCMGPACTKDSDCTKLDLKGTFMQCDTTTSQCVSTYSALFEGAGLSGQSCYIDYYDNQVAPSAWCNGCPTAFEMQAANPNWPTPADSCLNSNNDWVSVVEPYAEIFKEACQSAYSFPFDDPSSTFQCTNNSQNNSMPYEVSFCPGLKPMPEMPPPPPPMTDDDDDDDNNQVPKPEDFENFLGGNSLFVMTGPSLVGPADPGSFLQLNVTGRSIEDSETRTAGKSFARDLNNLKIEIIPRKWN